jgi:hypothetical protein
MIDSMDGAEEPTSSGWRSSGLRPQRGRMTGFLVAILWGGSPSHSRLLTVVLRCSIISRSIGRGGGGGTYGEETEAMR